MCSFHSVLSALQRHTGTNGVLERHNLQRRAEAAEARAQEAKQYLQDAGLRHIERVDGLADLADALLDDLHATALALRESEERAITTGWTGWDESELQRRRAQAAEARILALEQQRPSPHELDRLREVRAQLERLTRAITQAGPAFQSDPQGLRDLAMDGIECIDISLRRASAATTSASPQPVEARSE
jgi:hypothetical protein